MPSTPNANTSHNTSQQPSWANVTHPVESCDPLEILQEEIIILENKRALAALDTPSATTQSRFLHKYDAKIGQYTVTTLEPLARKP